MNNKTSSKLDNKTSKVFLIPLYNGFCNKKSAGVCLNNISTKYNLIRAVLNWVENTDGTEGKYQQKLKFACESLDIDDVLNCMDELEKWCKYRRNQFNRKLIKPETSVKSRVSKILLKKLALEG